MELSVFLAVLAAAIMHASWNVLVKLKLDRFLSLCLIQTIMGFMGVVMLLIFPLPSLASLPFAVASGVLHLGYNLFLARSYRTGDLSQVYPIARGAAPLLTLAVTWGFMHEDLTLMGGVRHTHTDYASVDHYIVGTNKDDSGSKRYQATLPVVGVRWQWDPAVQVFASLGKGHEIPTLNEVAYRSGGVSGFNNDLNAARSTSAELGLRLRAETVQWRATAFDIRTDDEIVVQNNTGGRTTFQNAGRTLRQGMELSGQWRTGPITLTSAYTRMRANYRDAFMTCATTGCPNVTPQVQVPTGNQIPGLPKHQLFAQAAWDTGWAGSRVTLEARHVGRVMVNDLNTDAAAAHTLFNMAVQFRQDQGDWTLREFIRVDNLTDRKHAGSVIVNDGNKRFFEPGAGRKLLLGLDVQRRF